MMARIDPDDRGGNRIIEPIRLAVNRNGVVTIPPFFLNRLKLQANNLLALIVTAQGELIIRPVTARCAVCGRQTDEYRLLGNQFICVDCICETATWAEGLILSN